MNDHITIFASTRCILLLPWDPRLSRWVGTCCSWSLDSRWNHTHRSLIVAWIHVFILTAHLARGLLIRIHHIQWPFLEELAAFWRLPTPLKWRLLFLKLVNQCLRVWLPNRTDNGNCRCLRHLLLCYLSAALISLLLFIHVCPVCSTAKVWLDLLLRRYPHVPLSYLVAFDRQIGTLCVRKHPNLFL